VFQSNVGDPSTLESQIGKLKGRFALERVVLVGDRGMITEARLNEAIKPAGLDWMTALRAPAIRGPLQGGQALRHHQSDDNFSFRRNIEQINAEAALDGIYVVRTSVNGEVLDASSTVRPISSCPTPSVLSAVSRAST
jgi:hypothetical protein